jgi:hypothetical protein
MKWEKLGRIYDAADRGSKLATHAANPLAVHRYDAVYRVFFSGRDAQNRSSVGWFDFDLDKMNVVDVCPEPAFLHGPSDSFYSHGVSIGCVYETGGERFMLFMGWHLPEGEHWRGEIGRLKIGPDLQLAPDPHGALLPLDGHDPISLSYPWVERESDGSYRMWYGSTLDWDGGNGEMIHIIKQALSDDGSTWRRLDDDLPWKLGVAQAFSRPTVLDGGDGTRHMWFSYRSGTGESYRIGYARQHEFGDWALRLDEAGIDVSQSGWDSEMIEYPFVFQHRGESFMLYNGDGFGKTGVGLARLQT